MRCYTSWTNPLQGGIPDKPSATGSFRMRRKAFHQRTSDETRQKESDRVHLDQPPDKFILATLYAAIRTRTGKA
jgi:hypothetical protein